MPFLFNIVLEILAIEIRLENKITYINIGKEEVEVENPRDPVRKKLLDLVRDLGEVVREKIDVQKQNLF